MTPVIQEEILLGASGIKLMNIQFAWLLKPLFEINRFNNVNLSFVKKNKAVFSFLPDTGIICSLPHA